MSKTGWIILAVAIAGGCCLFSGVAVMWLGFVSEGEGTVSGPVALAPMPGGSPAAVGGGGLTGTWGTQTLGLQPFDTVTGSFGPMNAEGITLTLNEDGTFERVWVKTMGGGRIGTYQTGSWEYEDGLLTLEADYSKTTAGGTPASTWRFQAQRDDSSGVPYLVLKDLDTGFVDRLRADGK